MESSQRQLICQRLPSLLEETNCNSTFLSVFTSRGVISSEDVEQITSTRVRQEQNKKFYEIITTRTNSFEQLLCALNQTNQSGALSILTETSDDPITTEDPRGSKKRQFQCKVDMCTPPKRGALEMKNTSIYFNVQQFKCNKHFSGRNTYLFHLKSSFKSGSTTIICQTILGLGGIGKSELGKRFISILKENAEKNCEALSIIWLNAESESKLSFDFRTLADDKLGISNRNSSTGEKDIRTIVQEVFDFFEDTKCVFVYDNAENSAYLTTFLPSSHSFRKKNSIKPSVLITSRDNNWAMESDSMINLDVFEVDEAVLYVNKGLRKTSFCESNASAHINALVVRLGKFPLALTHAISYIQQQFEYDATYGALNYLIELEENTRHLLDLKLDEHAQTTYETWNMTIHQISKNQNCGKEAIQLLYLLSYMSPDAISAEIFCEIISNAQKRRETILLLRRYSMIKLSRKTAEKEAQISIHRLVQEVIRLKLRAAKKEEEIIALALKTIASKVNPVNVNHVISLWNHTKLYSNIVNEYLDIPARIVSCHLSHCRLNEACEMAETELNYLKQILNTSTQKSFNHNLVTLKKLYCDVKVTIGEMEKPYEIYQTIITDYQQNSDIMSDDEELLYIKSLKGYAHLLYNMENYDKALSVYNLVETKLTHRFNDNRIELVHAQLWRDLVLCYLDKYEKPISCLIDLYKSSLSLPNFQMIFSVAHDIVYYLFYVAGNVEDAYIFCKDLLYERKKHLGERHFIVIQMQNMFASILIEKHYYEEALQISLDCYDICKATNIEHFETLNARKEVAWALIGKREFDQAFFILSQVISEMKDPLPRHLFDVFETKFALAQVLEFREEYKEAHNYLLDAKKDLNTVLSGTPYPLHNKKILQAIERVETKMFELTLK